MTLTRTWAVPSSATGWAPRSRRWSAVRRPPRTRRTSASWPPQGSTPRWPTTAAAVAILFGFCPKFGDIVAATPGGVLGGITLVLYGMIGLLGAKIWIENRVNFADPVNLVPLAGGIIAGIGNLTIKFTSTFSITGIAAGTLIVILGYHVVRVLRREPMLDEPAAVGRAYEGGTMTSAGNIETPGGEVSPFHEEEGQARRGEGSGAAGASPFREGEGENKPT